MFNCKVSVVLERWITLPIVLSPSPLGHDSLKPPCTSNYLRIEENNCIRFFQYIVTFVLSLYFGRQCKGFILLCK